MDGVFLDLGAYVRRIFTKISACDESFNVLFKFLTSLGF
jgi:hypothetical protein